MTDFNITSKTNINNTHIGIGNIFRNGNGNSYLVVAYNPELDRTLLQLMGKENYVGAWGLRSDSWCQGHYFMNDLRAAVDYVFPKNKEDGEG